MTQSGIEPATSQFVAQHIKHCATAVPDSDVGEQNLCEDNENIDVESAPKKNTFLLKIRKKNWIWQLGARKLQ